MKFQRHLTWIDTDDLFLVLYKNTALSDRTNRIEDEIIPYVSLSFSLFVGPLVNYCEGSMYNLSLFIH